MSLARLPETILEEARVLAAAGRPVPRASLIELTRIKDEDAQVTAWRAISTGVYDRATVRAFRKGSNSKPDTDVRPTLHVLAQRVERLTESLARTHGDAGWGQAELRQALLNLRSRIDLLLGEVG